LQLVIASEEKDWMEIKHLIKLSKQDISLHCGAIKWLTWQERNWLTSRVHLWGSFLPSRLSSSVATWFSSSSA